MERSCAFNFVFFPCIKMENSTNRNSTLEITNAELVNNKQLFTKLELLRNELTLMANSSNIDKFAYIDNLTPEKFNSEISDSVAKYLDELDRYFGRVSNISNDLKDRFYNANSTLLKKLETEYFNYRLQEIITKPYEREKILEYKNTLVQNTELIYLEPQNTGFLNFRTHFFAPSKYIFNIKVDTFIFNITLVALSSLIFYAMLYYNILSKFVKYLEKLKNQRIKRKNI